MPDVSTLKFIYSSFCTQYQSEAKFLYRRGACIRIAAPRRRLRKGRIRRSSQLRSRYSRQMVRARGAGPDFVADEGSESAVPRVGGASTRLRQSDAVRVVAGRPGPD